MCLTKNRRPGSAETELPTVTRRQAFSKHIPGRKIRGLFAGGFVPSFAVSPDLIRRLLATGDFGQEIPARRCAWPGIRMWWRGATGRRIAGLDPASSRYWRLRPGDPGSALRLSGNSGTLRLSGNSGALRQGIPDICCANSGNTNETGRLVGKFFAKSAPKR